MARQTPGWSVITGQSPESHQRRPADEPLLCPESYVGNLDPFAISGYSMKLWASQCHQPLDQKQGLG